MKNGGRIRCAFLMLLLFCATASTLAKSKKYVLYVGTYTDSGSKGIYAYEYDAASGKASPLGVAAETSNPSFLAVDARRKFLYAVNETHDYKGAASGSVTAFAVDPKTHNLRELNEVASRGADPCYISRQKRQLRPGCELQRRKRCGLPARC